MHPITLAGAVTAVPTQPSHAVEHNQANVPVSIDARLDAAAPKISTLARQLNECAERAAVRDKTLSRDALREVASRVNAELRSDRYTRGDAAKVFARDRTEDPELVARDRQAVMHNTSVIYGENSVPSPFAGLSRAELVLIAYDESDTFTINERYAAMRGATEHEQRLRRDFGRRSQEGFFNQYPALFYAEPLAQYRSIPLIEQVQYPDDYESSLETRMLESWAEQPPKDPERYMTLFEILAQVLRNGNRSDEQARAMLEPLGRPDTARSLKTSS